MLRNTFHSLVFNFILFGVFGGCGQKPNQPRTDKPQSSSTEIVISAASSMQNVLKKLETLYRQQYPQAKITFNFGSSGSLQHQIEQGAPIDVFISAAPQQMNRLTKKGLLLVETRRNLVENQMVLVVPKDSLAANDFADLSKKSVKQVALGEPNSVPAGHYAKEILTNINLNDHVQSKAVYGKDVRQVLNYVATGNVDAGIVYYTDAVNNKQVKIVATAPDTVHSPIVYPVAVVKDSNKHQAAKQLLQFLSTPEAQAIFKQYGFISVGNQELSAYRQPTAFQARF